MKNFLLVILAMLSMTAFAQTKEKPMVAYDFTILRITDGDTITFSAPFLPAPLKPELKVRIFGVDTPEKGSTAKCPAEIEKGKAASEFTRQQVKNAKVRQIAIMDWDKYGGRVLGDVILDGQSLRQILIESGYAREYYGGFKSSWCK